MASYPMQPFCVPTQVCVVVKTSSQNQADVEFAKQHKSIFLGVGVTQVILGVVCLGLGIASLPICIDGGCKYYCYPYEFYDFEYFGDFTIVATGIWGGALVIIFGSFGVAQAYDPCRCKITANITLSVFGILVTLAMLGLEIAAATISFHNVPLVVIHSLLSSFSFILFVLFIVSTSYAGLASRCCGSCRGCFYDDKYLLIPAANSQIITLPNGQLAFVQGPPQGHPQAVVASPVVNPPPQYNLAQPSGQQNFYVSSGQSSGVVNQGFQNDDPNKM